jgi:hypothetical protein
MYAYSMAAAHLNLPHQQMEHYMVSNTESGGEGWAHIDALEDSCIPPTINPAASVGSGQQYETFTYYPGKPLPNVIHYCQHFRVGDFAFGKRVANKQMFSCDAPLFREPPPNLDKELNYMHKGKVSKIKGNAGNE